MDQILISRGVAAQSFWARAHRVTLSFHSLATINSWGFDHTGLKNFCSPTLMRITSWTGLLL